MDKMINFNSVLAEQMQLFVAFKRMQGYDYTSQARMLSYFDSFLLDESAPDKDQGLTLDTLEAYIHATSHLKVFSRRAKLSSVREFTRYLHAKRPHSAVLPKDIGPRQPPNVRFCRIEPEQVADLMAATTILRANDTRTRTMSVLIGLLHSTGLRIGEALNLTLGDIDAHSSMLHVTKGKFGKQRLVPMSSSTLAAVASYLRFRSRHASTASSSPLFISAYNKPLCYWHANDSFHRLCRHCGLSGEPPPRLHDLRHNYACRRLALWRQEGKDVNAMLPVLSTAMGHVNIFRTQIYLHIEPSELHDAAARFHGHLNTDSEYQQ